MKKQQKKTPLLKTITKQQLSKLLFLVLVLVNSLFFCSTITLPENQYQIDHQRKMILCNTSLTSFTFDNDYITIKIGNEDYQVLDPVKNLELNKKYTIIGKSYIAIRFALYFTDLPLVYINTNETIQDSPKVLAKFNLIEQDGNLTKSNIGIEYRGATSQAYPKKSFEIEFWDDEIGNETTDLSLLGMREDKDWNLQAMYNEVLKIRSTTAWEIWQQMSSLYYNDKEPNAKTGISNQYVEVFQNNTYLGLFALSEKIDRKQLKLKKNTETEIRGELYKHSEPQITDYYSISDYDNSSNTWGGYEYKYPKDIIDWNNLYNLHDFVINSSDEEFNKNYAEKYDIDNLIDYFIFLNTINARDNTAKNLYTVKYDKDRKYFFIPWDLDTVFGRNWESTIFNSTDEFLSNYLYDRLWKDQSTNGFRAKLNFRWKTLRESFLTVDNIMSMLIENSNYLKTQGVYKREILANPGSTIEAEAEELSYIRDWLINRIAFLDSKFDFSTELNTTEQSNSTNTDIIFYPNPTKNYLYFLDKNDKTNHTSNINIYTLSGRKVKSISNHSFKESIYVGDLAKGTYFISFGDKNRQNNSRKLILN